jgi:hypothetical protein
LCQVRVDAAERDPDVKEGFREEGEGAMIHATPRHATRHAAKVAARKGGGGRAVIHAMPRDVESREIPLRNKRDRAVPPGQILRTRPLRNRPHTAAAT